MNAFSEIGVPSTRSGKASLSPLVAPFVPHDREIRLYAGFFVTRSRCEALDMHCDWLTEGNVFTPDLIETWIDYKRTNEIDPIRLRPHPHEFELYYDV